MFKAVTAWSAVAIALFMCGCFGPFDPTDPPPDRTSEGDPPGEEVPTHAPGLLAWWTCNDDTETKLADSTGAFDGTVSGCSRESGIEGDALRMNGTGSYVSVDPVSGEKSLNFQENDFTVSVWVKPQIMLQVNDSSRLDIIARGNVEETGFALTIVENRFTVALGPQLKKDQHDDFPADAGEWRHVVLTRNDGNVTVFVNTTEIISFYSDYSINFTYGLPLQMGRDNSGEQRNFYSGLIDEIKILDVSWDTPDVTKEYRRFVK
ncbi:MAG: LamG domain-containing protein [Chitinispirillaceae bacterium]|nr:LamG domain-containing protein [Chitinispirillaceae bacterium]